MNIFFHQRAYGRQHLGQGGVHQVVDFIYNFFFVILYLVADEIIFCHIIHHFCPVFDEKLIATISSTFKRNHFQSIPGQKLVQNDV